MKLYESIYILQRYSEIIECLTAIMVKNDYHRKRDWTKEDTIHYTTLYQNILMDVLSYFDEYDNYFETTAEEKFKNRIRAVKRIAKQAADKIRRWSGIREMRNEMISHNWRVKGSGEIILSKLGRYNTPRNFHDLLYLQTYITIIQTVIAAEFHDISSEIWPYIESIKTTIVPPPQTNPNFEQEIRTLVQEINIKCEEYGKEYRVNPEAIFLIKHSE